ncbi:hypothetical protein FRC14_003583 [Serendipita sp. 396]|nr:hypothetical protein FRC14_003583 [Serendipita sp. 396]KAG8783273.1 hypothetical protein FRC15_005508 [Serendipita sp. 397]
MSWETLPDEIKVLILENTAPYDIPKLRQTCQRNRKLIDSSIRLNYILELARDGYSLRHSCDSVPDIVGATKEHIEWRERWKQLDFGPAVLSFKTPETGDIFIWGNTIYSTGPNTLRSFALSKLALPNVVADSSIAWESRDFDMEPGEAITIFGGDVQQDLLIVGIDDANEKCIKLHFISISNMEPLSESRSAPKDFDCCYNIQVCGPMVLYGNEYEGDGRYKIYIRDWRSWSVAYEFDPGIEGLAVPSLLTDEYFAMLRVLPDESVVLELHKLGRDLVLTLQLPRIQESFKIESIGWDDANDFSAKFDRVVKPADFNFVVAAFELRLRQYRWSVRTSEYLLVMNKQELITLYESHSHQRCNNRLIWDDWEYLAQWVPIPTHLSPPWTRSGSIVALQVSFGFLDTIVPQENILNDSFYILRLDFGVSKPQKEDDLFLTAIPEARDQSVFEDDVSGGLGFRVTWSPSTASQIVYRDIFMTENTFITCDEDDFDVYWMGNP